MRLMTLCAVLVAALTMAACGNDSAPSRNAEDIPALQTIDTTVGTGAVAVAGQPVTVHYSGWLYSSTAAGNKGDLFDSSSGRAPIQFTLMPGSLITGWVQGIPGMRVGGKRTLLIPSAMGYGSRGSTDGRIPANSALVFDVELISVP